jgi:hypothetical protein
MRVSSPNYRLTACYSTDTGFCMELNRAGVGRAVNYSPATGFYFKDRSHTSTPPYAFRSVKIILYFVPLSSLTLQISVVLFVAICVTATVSL